MASHFQLVFMMHIAVPLLALAVVFGGTVHATPLDDLRTAPVPRVEFGAFKLEVALGAIKDWPVPFAGAAVSYRIDPDHVDIVIAAQKVPAESFRTACAQTIGRVRSFLYVDANGVAPMGRSYLSAYFRGSWRGAAREAALRALDASTLIKVDVVGVGSCQAGLVKSAVTFHDAPAN